MMMTCAVRTKTLFNDSVYRLTVPIYDVLQLRYSSSKNKVSQELPDTIQIIKPTNQSSSVAALKIKTISKAMKAYLERSKKHESFLEIKNQEFELGKLHLANMMGLDAATLTQDDIDKAITYLLPSGLYDKKARPLMKPPIKLYPKEKAAQFDNSGRPFSSFFYTNYPNYYTCMHDLASTFRELDDFEDKMIEKGILEPPSDSVINTVSGEWFTLDEFQKLFLEKVTDDQYDSLIKTLNRLVSHPYSFRCKDVLWKYRKEFVDLTTTEVVPELLYDEDGRPYMQMEGFRKHCKAKVTVRGNGTGKFTVNGSDIFYFDRLHDREQVMHPLDFCGLLGVVDVEADVHGPGKGGAQAGAIRHGISLCLRSFVSPDLVEKMRLAGLITRDARMPYRKMPGFKGNRAKYTWRKR